MSKLNLGKVSLTPKGEWNASTTYERLDVVSYEGSSYTVLKECQGIVPVEGEFYSLLAMKGEPGEDFILHGGTSGQLLSKGSNADGDFKWMDLPYHEHDDRYYTIDDIDKISQCISNSNLLDNWHFINPINQRGKTGYTGVGYTIDRWKLINSNDNTGDSSLLINENSDITITLGKDNGIFAQYVEDPKRFAGLMLTASVLCKNVDRENATQIVINDGTTQNAMGLKNGIVSISMTISQSPTALIVKLQNVSTYTAHSLDVIAIKLEIGSRQTLGYQDTDGNWILNDPPPNKSIELQKCQRYQLGSNWTTNNYMHGSGWVESNKSGVAVFPTPVQMRIAPTMKPVDGSNWSIRVNGEKIIPSELTTYLVGRNCVLFHVHADFSDSPNTPFVITPNSEQIVVFDSNL